MPGRFVLALDHYELWASQFQIELPRGWHFARSDYIVNPGRFWLPEHDHTGFVRCAISFALVALGTGARSVAPRITPAAAFGLDVIQGEITLRDDRTALCFAGTDATVDTVVAIALKDAAPTPTHAAPGGAYIAA